MLVANANMNRFDQRAREKRERNTALWQIYFGKLILIA